MTAVHDRLTLFFAEVVRGIDQPDALKLGIARGRVGGEEAARRMHDLMRLPRHVEEHPDPDPWQKSRRRADFLDRQGELSLDTQSAAESGRNVTADNPSHAAPVT